MSEAGTAQQLRESVSLPEGLSPVSPVDAEPGSASGPLLVHLARICMRPEVASSVRPGEWPGITELALRHGVASLLYYRTREQSVPQATRRHWAGLYRRNLARNLKLQQEQETVLKALHHDARAAIALKGSGLGEFLYGDVGARQVADLDLLIQPRDLASADAALRALGYERVTADPLTMMRYCRDVLYEKPRTAGGSMVVDLHMRLRPYGRRDTLTALLWREGTDRKSTRLNSSHIQKSRMPSSA